MLWLAFAAWTLVAAVVVALDRRAWRPVPAGGEPPAARPAGTVLTTPVVQPSG
jgi:hypothetical protein